MLLQYSEERCLGKGEMHLLGELHGRDEHLADPMVDIVGDRPYPNICVRALTEFSASGELILWFLNLKSIRFN